MAIAVATSRQALANYYGTQATWIGAATGAPGTSSTPANEASGGSPAYARKATTWSAGSGGVITGSAVTIDLPAGTYTNFILCTAATGNTQFDNGSITSSTLTGQSTLIITATYTQT
jgi:hypothetical protein